jgi:hypothetical protein
MEANEPLLYVMAGAVVVSALALALLAVFMGVMARAATAIRSRLEQLAPKAESVLDSAEKTLAESKSQISELTAKASELTVKANAALEVTRLQLGKTDEFLTDLTQRARVQLDRVELVLDDTVSRVHETIVVLNKGVLWPLREVSAVGAGIRTALHYLVRGGKPSVDRATTDEEMFI